MLSYDEFVAKHPNYQGLSKGERRKRYEDYARSSAAAARIDRKVKPRGQNRSEALSARLGENQVERATRKHLEEDEFFQALIDPFGADPARVPSMDGRSTAVYKCKFNIPVQSDANGNACIFFVPRIQACYAVSKTSSALTGQQIADFPELWEAGGAMGYDAFNSLSNAGDAQSFGWWTDASWAVMGSLNSNWDTLGTGEDLYTGLADVPQAGPMIEQFTDYIVTSAGMSFQYTGSLLNAAGQVAVAPLRAAYGVPHVFAAAFNLNPSLGQLFSYGRVIETAGSEQMQGPTYEWLEQLDEAQVFKAVDGFTQTWRPGSADILECWRPNRFMPSGMRYAADRVSDQSVTGTMHLPPSCGSNPATFSAWYDALWRNNPYVSAAADASLLYGPIGSGSSTTDAVNTRKAIQSISTLYGNVSMHESDESLMAIFTGLPPSETIGNVEFVINIEAMVESRSFNAAPRLARNGGMKTALAIHAAHASPPAYPGFHADVADDGVPANEHAAGNRLVEGVKAAVPVVQDIVTHAGDIGEAISGAVSTVAEIAGVVGSLFL